MTKLAVSYSEINTARQCPHKHLLSYKQRWTRQTSSLPLIRGTNWHSILELWYKGIKDENVTEATTIINELIESVEDEEQRDILQWMWSGYQEKYGFDQEWEIIDVENKYETWLPTPTGSRSKIRIKLKIDMVIRDRSSGKYYVVDHKSTGSPVKTKDYALDDQFGLYVWGMKQLGYPIFGSYHSAALTRKNKVKPQDLDDRFARTRLYRTDKELQTLAVEAYHSAAAVWYQGHEHRTPNTETCSRMCDYKEACLGGRKGMDEQRLLEASGFVQDFTRH